ncbi:MAG: DUF3592 domain-containing protein [Clostridia bacterium]|nr:DUF3592 domain-containing protein [Clostridia bacterium]
MKLSSIANGYRRIFIVIFCFVMAALLTFGGFIVAKNSQKEYAETQATIVEITTDYIGDDITHDVYVDYEVNGVTYNHVHYGGYQDSYAEGQTITILYEVNNPENTGTNTPSWLKYLLFVGAVVFLAAGIAAIVMIARSSAKGKAMENAPVITGEGREIGEPKKLYFSLDPKTHVKLHFYMEDESKNVLYEARMTKHGIGVPHTYVFTDHRTHTETEHKVGLVNSAEADGWKVSQGFTFDGVDIARYFDANGITVDYAIEGKGFRLSISHNGKHIADAITSSRHVHEEDAAEHKVESSLLRFNNYYFRVVGQPSYIDVIFLVLFKEAISPRASSLL